MSARYITSDEVRNGWSEVVENITSGGTVVVDEANRPVAAIISFDEYQAFRKQKDELSAANVTEADWERVAMEVLDEYDGAWRRLADL